MGDSALLAVARRLARDLKPGDTLARLSGDQFGAIILADRSASGLTARIDGLRAALAAPISFGEREIALTVSIGAARLRPETACQGRRTARRRGARARQREEGRRRPGRTVRAGHALAALGPANAGERHAPRARARRDQGAVPADRAAGGSHRRRVPGVDCAGGIPNSAFSTRPSSSRSPSRPASSSTSAPTPWRRRRANLPRGRRRWRSGRRFSPPSPRPRASC